MDTIIRSDVVGPTLSGAGHDHSGTKNNDLLERLTTHPTNNREGLALQQDQPDGVRSWYRSEGDYDRPTCRAPEGVLAMASCGSIALACVRREH